MAKPAKATAVVAKVTAARVINPVVRVIWFLLVLFRVPTRLVDVLLGLCCCVERNIGEP